MKIVKTLIKKCNITLKNYTTINIVLSRRKLNFKKERYREIGK